MSYFRSWPFRVVPQESPETWADRKELLEKYRNIIDDVVKRKRSVISIVWGEFGAGKSHSLLHLRHTVQSELGCQAVYSPLPKQIRQYSDLYRQGFIGALDFSDVAKATASLWNRLNPHGVDRRIELESVETVSKDICKGWYDFAQVLSTLGRTMALTGNPTDRQCLAGAAWLRGQKLSTNELRLLGVSGNIVYESDFVRATTALVRLFVYSSQEVKPLFWLLDDCHYMATMGRKGLVIIQQGIKDVFNACPEDLGLVMAFASKDSSSLERLLIDDIRSRTLHRVEIPIMSENETEEFIGDLINDPVFRNPGAKQTLYPFKGKALKTFVNRLSKSVDLIPREIMKALDPLVSKAEAEIFPEQIDEAFVNDFMQGYRAEESREQ